MIKINNRSLKVLGILLIIAFLLPFSYAEGYGLGESTIFQWIYQTFSTSSTSWVAAWIPTWFLVLGIWVYGFRQAILVVSAGFDASAPNFTEIQNRFRKILYVTLLLNIIKVQAFTDFETVQVYPYIGFLILFLLSGYGILACGWTERALAYSTMDLIRGVGSILILFLWGAPLFEPYTLQGFMNLSILTFIPSFFTVLISPSDMLNTSGAAIMGGLAFLLVGLNIKGLLLVKLEAGTNSLFFYRYILPILNLVFVYSCLLNNEVKSGTDFMKLFLCSNLGYLFLNIIIDVQESRKQNRMNIQSDYQGGFRP